MQEEDYDEAKKENSLWQKLKVIIIIFIIIITLTFLFTTIQGIK